MGWQRTLSLSNREPFPTPIKYVEWELYPPHASLPLTTGFPTTRPINPDSKLPPGPQGSQATVQPNQFNPPLLPPVPPVPPPGFSHP